MMSEGVKRLKTRRSPSQLPVHWAYYKAWVAIWDTIRVLQGYTLPTDYCRSWSVLSDSHIWRTGTWLEAILNTAGRSVSCIPISFKALGSGGCRVAGLEFGPIWGV